ncbi:MAG TPA: hypothetical protein VG796_21695 [Verrucomicrobiales bacterium]|nr:hypothetical protein [Verrucomicrobiales bacterium]
MRIALLLTVFSIVAGFAVLCQAQDEKEEAWQVPVLLGKDGWMTYQNPRFGFSLPVPPGMKTERPPDNGGGQSFVSADGKFKVAGWGHFNADEATMSVDAAFKSELAIPGRTISYKRKADGWYVVSGVNRDGTGFYTKYAADTKHVAGFSITYPQADEKKYQAWIERIAKAWQARLGKGEDTLEKNNSP